MPEDKPATEPRSAGTPQTVLNWFTSTGLKETVASFIAIGVTALTLHMFCKLFSTPGSAKREVLEMMTPIFGVIVGYYFGRAPAEARAQNAEQARENADKRADDANRSAAGATEQARAAEARVGETDRKLRDAKATVESALSKLDSQAPLRKGIAASGTVDKAVVESGIDRVREQLEDLGRRLGD